MLVVFVCVGLVVAVTLAILDKALKSRNAYMVSAQLPGATMYPVIGNLLEIFFLSPQNTFRYLRQSAQRYGRSHRLWIFGVLHFNAIRARDIETLMVSSKNITKSEVYNFLHPLMGTGLLTSTGVKWFQRRRILTPAFHFSILEDFLGIFREESVKLVNTLNTKHHQSRTVLQEIIPRFTLNTICESAMGVRIDSMNAPDAYRRNLYKMGEWLVYRCMNPCIHSNAIYKLTGLPFILNKYLKPVHDFSWGVIDRRRQAFDGIQIDVDATVENEECLYFNTKKKRQAMLDTLFEAEKTNHQIDQQGIREEVDTFMFEGYDTTSAALTFCLLMSAHHAKEQQLLCDEILTVLDGRDPNQLDIQSYNSMQFMDRFIKETLRLYPPVPYMGREITETMHIGDITLPIGTQFHIHTYDLHRDPEQFPDPERFDPDRFLPENKASRHPFAYAAFSAGPRNCIGQRFAMLEIKCVLTHILLNFLVEPITPVNELVFVSDIVLRPKDNIEVKFTPRHNIY